MLHEDFLMGDDMSGISRRGSHFKGHVSIAALAISLFAGVNPTFAQTAAPHDSAATEEVVVTGSRVVRDGYQAPTPVTVLSPEELNARADINIADTVNQLPQFTSSVTQISQPSGLSGGTLGTNELNLRGLGASRTLVLLDGKRMINASINTQFAAPDINTIPNGLVTRVDVVTGGASAAYGSDALTGVANFVLDHDFTGVKGKVQGGITTYGDNAGYTTSLTAGTGFGPGDRGHFLFSGELSHNDGVQNNNRPWNAGGGSAFTNPAFTATNGLPFYLTGPQTGLSDGTPGGLITAGPLRGIQFGPGGIPSTFNFGLVSAGNIMQGGDWQTSRINNIDGLVSRESRQVAYSRVSYDITDNFQLYAELQWAFTHDKAKTDPAFVLGTQKIQSDNAFIPASIAAQLVALNQTSFTMGSTNADIGNEIADNRRLLSRWAVGGNGKFGVFGSEWKWDAYYQQTSGINNSTVANDVISANYALAIDAVRNPATGGIVCRSTLANPTNGCVPYDALGIGVNTRSAINYVTGTAQRHESLEQDVGAINVHGEPFSTWAGPVSLASGIEHRRERVDGLASALDETNSFFVGDFHASHGAYSVTEGYVETVVPLAKDQSWAKALDLNGAIRGTGYTTSGEVTTWKVGATYSPFDDLRIRATRSRDIRAPNLGELFSGGQSSTGQPLNDPFTNTQTANSTALSKGNPLLKPEVATTTGAGVVISPSFFPGFQASVDYYNVDIAGFVKIPSAQNVIDLCFAGNQTQCSFITRTAGVITLVQTSPSNVAQEKAEGVDLEASYLMPLSNIHDGWKGKLSFHALGTYVMSLQSIDNTGGVNGTGVVQGAGVVGNFVRSVSAAAAPPSAPKFRSTLFMTYDNDLWSATVTWHYIAAGVYNKAFASCTSGCPIGSNLSIADNSVGSNTTFDLALSYKPFKETNADLFLTINNIANQYPPFIGGNVGSTYYLGQNNFNYDRIGRTYEAGIRFEL